MRAVRDAHQRWLVANGYAIVHAAAVSYGDRVVLITGPRESGKTTLLTYLVAHAGATYLTNDRCAVDRSGSAVAVPTMLSIRAGTFTLVPGLGPIPWRRGQRPRHLIAELVAEEDTTGGPASLSPAQFCTWLGAERVRRGRVSAIVFPVAASDGPTIRGRVSDRRAETRLGTPTTDHLAVNRYVCHVDDYRIDAAPALLALILQADDDAVAHDAPTAGPFQLTLLRPDSATRDTMHERQ
jgi:hypothetical protein